MNIQKIESLPKIDLHCHLDGSLTQSCISNLLGRRVELSELQVADDCKDLAQYLEKFNLPLQGLQTESALYSGAYDFIENVSKENIKYVEVRFAPLLSMCNGLNENKIIEAVLGGLKRGKEKFGVESNIIVSLMRGHNEEDNLRLVKKVKDYVGYGVCAIDLAGNEAAYPMSEFVNIFKYANSLDIPFTIHAGECGNIKNITDAVECGAKRIGHGIALMGNYDIQKQLAEKKIGIEMCPISNQQTKSVSDISKYPIKEFLTNGLLVTINTDNRTVSNTSISKEIQFIQNNFNITDDEVIRMIRNAFEVSFATDEQKHTFYKYK